MLILCQQKFLDTLNHLKFNQHSVESVAPLQQDGERL